MFFCGEGGKSGVCQSISSSISDVIGKNTFPDKSSLLQKIQIFSFIKGKNKVEDIFFFCGLKFWEISLYSLTVSFIYRCMIMQKRQL